MPGSDATVLCAANAECVVETTCVLSYTPQTVFMVTPTPVSLSVTQKSLHILSSVSVSRTNVVRPVSLSAAAASRPRVPLRRRRLVSLSTDVAQPT